MNVALADLFVAATLKMTFGEELTAMPETKDAVVSFLLKRLESLDGQKGKYRRDVRLSVPFGTNPYLQVDLCSEAEKKVIFIAGGLRTCPCDRDHRYLTKGRAGELR